jgi:hypothetical protein
MAMSKKFLVKYLRAILKGKAGDKEVKSIFAYLDELSKKLSVISLKKDAIPIIRRRFISEAFDELTDDELRGVKTFGQLFEIIGTKAGLDKKTFCQTIGISEAELDELDKTSFCDIKI